MDRIKQKIRLSAVIARKLVAEETLSAAEEEELRAWLERDERNREFYEALLRGGTMADYEAVVAAYDQERGWRRLSGRLHRGGKKRWLRWTSVAAGVAALLAVGVWTLVDRPADESKELTVRIAQIEPGKSQAVLYLASGERLRLEGQDTTLSEGRSNIRVDKVQVEYDVEAGDTATVYNRIVVPRRGIYSLVLSDGTKVYLNSESELSYPVKFQGNVREVMLKGEAYFEVTADASRPFVVRAGEMRTRVLGTSFNVSAYPDEAEFQTTLVTGKVEVSVGGVVGSRMLEPGMQAVWERRLGKVAVRKVSAEALTQWREGIIVMNGEGLDDVMRSLCRWYDVRYEYCGAQGEEHTFTGRIDRNEYLDDVLKTLTLMGGPEFEIRDSVVYIK